jgi:hypothetical protein
MRGRVPKSGFGRPLITIPRAYWFTTGSGVTFSFSFSAFTHLNQNVKIDSVFRKPPLRPCDACQKGGRHEREIRGCFWRGGISPSGRLGAPGTSLRLNGTRGWRA